MIKWDYRTRRTRCGCERASALCAWPSLPTDRASRAPRSRPASAGTDSPHISAGTRRQLHGDGSVSMRRTIRPIIGTKKTKAHARCTTIPTIGGACLGPRRTLSTHKGTLSTHTGHRGHPPPYPSTLTPLHPSHPWMDGLTKRGGGIEVAHSKQPDDLHLRTHAVPAYT